jgi:hypothetical protein
MFKKRNLDRISMFKKRNLDQIIMNFSPFNQTKNLLFKISSGVNIDKEIYLQDGMLPFNLKLISDYVYLYKNSSQEKENIILISKNIEIDQKLVLNRSEKARVIKWFDMENITDSLIPPHRMKMYSGYKNTLVLSGLCCNDYGFSSNAKQSGVLRKKSVSYRLFPTQNVSTLHVFDKNYMTFAFEQLSLKKEFNKKFLILDINIELCHLSIMHSLFSNLSNEYSLSIQKKVCRHFGSLLKTSNPFINGPMGDVHDLRLFKNMDQALAVIIQEYETCLIASTFVLLKEDPFCVRAVADLDIIFSSHHHTGLIVFINKDQKNDLEKAINFYFKLTVKQLGLNCDVMKLKMNYALNLNCTNN